MDEARCCLESMDTDETIQEQTLILNDSIASFKIPSRFGDAFIKYRSQESPIELHQQEDLLTEREKSGVHVDKLSNLLKYSAKGYRFPYCGFLLFTGSQKIIEVSWNEYPKWIPIGILSLCYLHWMFCYMKKEDTNPIAVILNTAHTIYILWIFMIFMGLLSGLQLQTLSLFGEIVFNFPFVINFLFMLWLMNYTDLFAFIDHQVKTIEFSLSWKKTQKSNIENQK